MTKQQEGDYQRQRDEAHEAVKDILRLYLDWSLEEIIEIVGPGYTGNWRIQMGGEIVDQGELHSLHRQIAVIGPGRRDWAIFDVETIMAELRQEQEDVEVVEPTPTGEEGERCRYCGSALEVKTGTGRNRYYCHDKCRVADFRRRKAAEQRAALLQQSDLVGTWEQHHLEGELLAMLQNIFLEYGEGAARATTDAVILAMQEQATRTAKEEPAETSRQAKRLRKCRSDQGTTD